MNPLNPFSVTKDLTRAVTFPFTFVFVVGLTACINWFTSPGHWWFQWVAFGMGIALLCIWARALKTLLLTVGLAGIGYVVYRWWKGREAGNSAAQGTIVEHNDVYVQRHN